MIGLLSTICYILYYKNKEQYCYDELQYIRYNAIMLNYKLRYYMSTMLLC